jgi:hypothetical protein
MGQLKIEECKDDKARLVCFGDLIPGDMYIFEDKLRMKINHDYAFCFTKRQSIICSPRYHVRRVSAVLKYTIE